MAAQLLEGKLLAAKIKDQMKENVGSLSKRPKLASIQIGDDAGASVYLKSQERIAEEIGILFEQINLPSEAKERDLIERLNELNRNDEVDGIIVQRPLPVGFEGRKITAAIDPSKDAEGMHPENLGRLLYGLAPRVPCTAAAVMALIESTGVPLRGKEAVVVGHSEIVGKPVALLLLDKFATVTICHIATGERGLVPEHVGRAEVLVVAVGKAGLIKGSWVREGAIVIDVGINRVGEKIVGDVEFEEASKRASYITPVPGGVGPLTVVMLMRNVVRAVRQLESRNSG